jgi:hypothetical protein
MVEDEKISSHSREEYGRKLKKSFSWEIKIILRGKELFIRVR